MTNAERQKAYRTILNGGHSSKFPNLQARDLMVQPDGRIVQARRAQKPARPMSGAGLVPMAVQSGGCPGMMPPPRYGSGLVPMAVQKRGAGPAADAALMALTPVAQMLADAAIREGSQRVRQHFAANPTPFIQAEAARRVAAAKPKYTKPRRSPPARQSTPARTPAASSGRPQRNQKPPSRRRRGKTGGNPMAAALAGALLSAAAPILIEEGQKQLKTATRKRNVVQPYVGKRAATMVAQGRKKKGARRGAGIRLAGRGIGLPGN